MAGTIRLSAVVARLRRRLAKDGIRLVRTRGGAANRWYGDLGEWHTVDSRNYTAGHVCPESLARELGVVSPAEVVIDDQEAAVSV